MADILAIAAHPDDLELNIAGTLIKSAEAGRSIALCDLTRGERGTRGSATLRSEETARASAIMGIGDADRWNLEMPDGGIAVTDENVLKVVAVLRHFRPEVLLFPWERDRHPDHERAHELVRRAYFDAGLRHVETEWNGQAQQPHRPARLYTFMQSYERTPDFIVDISAQFERKLDAIAAYSSQFTIPGRTPESSSSEPETFISAPDFMEFAIARMRHWGFMIGARYGEAFVTVQGPVKVGSLADTL
jgi:bacillithiol biosynthesis deacetylase BshB1